MIAAVIIPFREGADPLRRENLDRVLKQWHDSEMRWLICQDEPSFEGQPFNRSQAYNRGVRHGMNKGVDVYVFAESDMLIDLQQIDTACDMAMDKPGLVVPFTTYRYLTKDASTCVRGGQDPYAFTPRWTMDKGASIGAINVVSSETMELVGQWDEKFSGNSYDDDAMKIAFEVCAGPTRWVTGDAHHLYHLPGNRGRHLTPEDRAATERNRHRLGLYRAAAARKMDADDCIRRLTLGIW